MIPGVSSKNQLNRIAVTRFSVVLAAILTLLGSTAAGQGTSEILGNYHESKIYYEIHGTPFFLLENKELLHDDKVKLWHFPPVDVDVTDWNWRLADVGDQSWWVQIEELRFLLPLLESPEVRDRELARRWFLSWYESNRFETGMGLTRWSEPMSVAYRGMVLVYFLKTEELLDEPGPGIRAKLRETILEHLLFLTDKYNFSDNSNHGLVEAFGLLEVCRVFPGTEFENLALDRLMFITEASVSELGTHMEHSPNYHFVFLDWLDKFTAYLEQLTYLDNDRVAGLADYVAKMKNITYYMQDHDGTIPQIGDADSLSTSSRWPQYLDLDWGTMSPVLFDAEAGYAVYKDQRRYLLFTIQNRIPDLHQHYHDDVMSVYYRYGGETILGDPGKYQHTRSYLRRWFTSITAHNSVFPARLLTGDLIGHSKWLVAGATSLDESKKRTTFSARTDYKHFSAERTVSIYRRGSGFEVRDIFVRLGVPASESAVDDETQAAAALVWNLGCDVDTVYTEDSESDGVLVIRAVTFGGQQFRLSFEVTGDFESAPVYELVKGQLTPLRGWYSPSMFVMRPTFTISLEVPVNQITTVRTRIESLRGKGPPGLRILWRGY